MSKTDWISNFSLNLAYRAALEEAFRLGESYGRSLEGFLVEQDSMDPDMEVYRSWSREEKDAHDAAMAALWEKFNAEHWHPGCGRPIDQVFCALCSQGYSPEGPDGIKNKQGSRCCAWVLEVQGRKVIHGGYGSVVADMQEFHIQDSPKAPHLPKGLDPICDSCILRMIADGVLIHSRETGPFGE